MTAPGADELPITTAFELPDATIRQNLGVCFGLVVGNICWRRGLLTILGVMVGILVVGVLVLGVAVGVGCHGCESCSQVREDANSCLSPQGQHQCGRLSSCYRQPGHDYPPRRMRSDARRP